MLNDTITPNDGSLSVRIQFDMPKGRGLSLPFAFAYDSNGAHVPVGGQGSAYWGASSQMTSTTGGWSYTVPSITAAQLRKPDQNGNDCAYFDDYIFFDAAGGRHALDLTVVADPVLCANAGRVNNLNGGDGFFQGAIPASQLWYPPTPRVADADGTVYQFSPLKDFGPLSGALVTSIEDRNGNQMKINDLGGGAFTYVDTLGRSVLSFSGFAASPATVTISGLSKPYSIYFGTAPANFSTPTTGADFPTGCHRGFQPTQGSSGVISAIGLPDGTQYSFEYEPVYGLLSKITYPGGGWAKYTWSANPQSERIRYTAIFPGQEEPSCSVTYDKFAISKREVSFNGVDVALEQDFSYSTNWGLQPWWKQTSETTKDLVLGTSTKTVYTYSSDFSDVPVEKTITYYDGGGATVRTVNKTWLSTNFLGLCTTM